MDLSIIIITRNTYTLTRAAVQSVLAETGTLAKEIIVVDNGSTDETAAKIPAEFPALKWIRSEKNLGFSRACNLGAKVAVGDFILLLNSDARPQPEALTVAVTWMRNQADCDVAGAQLINPDGTLQNSIANFPTLTTELLNKSLLRRLFPKRFPGKETRHTQPIEVETVVGAFMLIRRTVWEKYGGMDERFFFFLEETDFCLQVRLGGGHVFHLPEVRVWHGQGQTAKQVSVGARIEYWRSRYAYFQKNHNYLTQLILSGSLMVRLLVDWLAALLLTLITLGKNTHWHNRYRICSALVSWHLRGRPQSEGLPR